MIVGRVELQVAIDRSIEHRRRIVLVDDDEVIVQAKLLRRLAVIVDDQGERVRVAPMRFAIDGVLRDEQERLLIDGADADQIVAVIDAVGHLAVRAAVLVGDRDVRDDLSDGRVLADGNDRVVGERLDEGDERLRTVVVLVDDENVHGDELRQRVLAQVAHLNGQPVRLFRFVVEPTDERQTKQSEARDRRRRRTNE